MPMRTGPSNMINDRYLGALKWKSGLPRPGIHLLLASEPDRLRWTRFALPSQTRIGLYSN